MLFMQKMNLRSVIAEADNLGVKGVLLHTVEEVTEP